MFAMRRTGWVLSFFLLIVYFTAPLLGWQRSTLTSSAGATATPAPSPTAVPESQPYRAVWVSYLEWQQVDFSSAQSFTADISTMLDNIAALGATVVLAQVRPFGDALYPSNYYPFSHLCTGVQGQDPGFDPLALLMQAAHARDLQLEAWINPYRLQSGNFPLLCTQSLALTHPEWTKTTSNGLYLDPANAEVRAFIADAVAELCRKYGVRVVSDEIHCELTLYDNEYVPFGSLPDELSRDSITCCSPSKAFNTAGLQIANIVCRDAEVRNRIDRAININEVCDVNPFGVIALQAAYSDEGYEWLTQLRKYISANYDLLLERFARELPKCKVMRMEGTYLAWIDCSELHIPSEEIEEILMHENKVWVNAGSMYGAEGAAFIRINMACTSELLNEGITRIVNGLGDK